MMVTTTAFGDEQDDLRYDLAEAPAEQRQKWAMRSIPVSNPALSNLEISGADVPSDSISVTIGFSTMRFASGTGTRLFFVPNLMERGITAPSPSVVRLSPVRLTYPFRRTDSLVYRLPDGYKVEAMPARVTVSPSFGLYSSSVAVVGDTAMVYTRVLEMRDRVIPLERYNEYRSVLADIVKADRAQAVLVKK
jgi:hypothetical protein